MFIGEDSDAVAVAVRDHGIGLSEEDAVRVFERFWRKDPARARTTGGSGLGLSIARADAQLHGGALEAWGKPGVGSTFRLTLPKTLGAKIAESPLPLGPYGKEIGAVEAAVAAEAEESKSAEDKAVTAGAATEDKKDPASTEGSEAR